MVDTFKEQLGKIKSKVPKSLDSNENIKAKDEKPKNYNKHATNTNLRRRGTKLSKKKINEIKNKERKIRDHNLNVRLKKIRPILEKLKSRENEKTNQKVKEALKAENYILDEERSKLDYEESLINSGTHERKTVVCKYCKGDGGLSGTCHNCGGTGFVTELVSI